MDIKDSVEWTQLAQVDVQFKAVVNVIMNLWVLYSTVRQSIKLKLFKIKL
jgi:hypothetical protein